MTCHTGPHSTFQSFKNILAVFSFLPLLQAPFPSMHYEREQQSCVLSFLGGICHFLEAVHVTALGHQLCDGLKKVYDL